MPGGQQGRCERLGLRAPTLIVGFDASALLPLIIEEPSSTDASRPWDEAKAVVSSLPVYAKGRAALAVACRTGRLDVLRR